MNWMNFRLKNEIHIPNEYVSGATFLLTKLYELMVMPFPSRSQVPGRSSVLVLLRSAYTVKQCDLYIFYIFVFAFFLPPDPGMSVIYCWLAYAS